MKKDKRKFNETGFGQFCKSITKDIPSIAGDVFEIATSSNPIGTTIGKVTELLKGEAEKNNTAKIALAELQRNQLDWELETYRAESLDRERASKSYVQRSEMADRIAENIISRNLLFIAILLGFNIAFNVLSTIFIDDKTIAVSIGSTIATAIGTVIGSMLQERNQVVGFFFGSSLKNKEFKVN